MRGSCKVAGRDEANMIAKLKWLLLLALRGGVASARSRGVTIGSGCRIYTSHFGSEPWLVTIGNRVTVTSGVRFLTHDGATWLVRDDQERRFRYAPIHIGSDVFIGVDSILMPGVVIGDRCIVGAGSVVTRSVPSGYVVAGAPARIVGRFEAYAAKARHQFPRGADMRGTSYRERIDSVLECEPAPPLAIPDEFREALVSAP
jgi:acetyltransferase-like isoleucine patch superfamily enzyme